MIKLFRVDDRLLHGQIAFSWVKNLKIHTILIANDYAKNDPFTNMTLGLSKPSGVNLRIEDVDTSIKLIREKITNDLHTMVIVKTLDDALLMINQIPEITLVNLGALRERYHTKYIDANVSLSKEEIDICKDLLDRGIDIEIQLTYKDKKTNLKDQLYEN